MGSFRMINEPLFVSSFSETPFLGFSLYKNTNAFFFVSCCGCLSYTAFSSCVSFCLVVVQAVRRKYQASVAQMSHWPSIFPLSKNNMDDSHRVTIGNRHIHTLKMEIISHFVGSIVFFPVVFSRRTCHLGLHILTHISSERYPRPNRIWFQDLSISKVIFKTKRITLL
jgi:hypothetical protein